MVDGGGFHMVFDVLKSLSDRESLGLTIIGEARGEPIEGQVAVGCVIRNRLHNSPAKYKNYHDVVFEHLQFSCWNEHDSNYPYLLDLAKKMVDGTEITDPHLRQCFWVAQGIIDWIIIDNVAGAINYLERSLYDKGTVKWAKNAKHQVTYGNQVFFTL